MSRELIAEDAHAFAVGSTFTMAGPENRAPRLSWARSYTVRDDFKGSSIEFQVGRDLIPGLG